MTTDSVAVRCVALRCKTEPDSFLRGDERLTYEDLDRPATALPRWFLDALRCKTEPDSFLRGDERLTYEDLDRPATALLRWFLDEGLRAGDRVAIHWSNSTEVVRLFFAILKAGLIAVPLNLRTKPAGPSYILGHSQAVFCVSEPALAPLAEEVRANCPALRRILAKLAALDSDTCSELPNAGEDQPAAIP